MKAMEVITIQATNPGAGAAFPAVAGNSLTVRDSSKPIWLGPVWQHRVAAGFLRITSPRLHDAVVGIQLTAPVGNTCGLMRAAQRVYPQDTLVAFGSGSGAAIEIAAFLLLYEDLPGVEGSFISPEDLSRRGEELYSWQNTLASGITGGYSGSESINIEQDQLKAKEDYAIIGYQLSVGCAVVRYVSSDWGNIGVGGPGQALPGSADLTREWFVNVSRSSGLPCIPVFNAANKSLTTIDCVQDNTGVDPIITTMGVRLSPRSKK